MTSFRLDVWPPLPPAVYMRRATTRLPFPLGEDACRIYSRARHALWHGVSDVGLQSGDIVLVPAYHHGSEIEALLTAGLVVRYYAQDRALQPDTADLEALLDGRVRALYLIHYLGFPSDAKRWRDWCDRQGLLLIEDAAQSWLAMDGEVPVGSAGDIAIYCLYKSFGLPDGAAIITRSYASAAPLAAGLASRRLARRHLAWLEQRVRLPIAARRPDGGYRPEVDFALGDVATGVSRTTLFLLPRVVEESAADKRRANYARLLEELGTLVPAPFDVLPAGAVPFAFPIGVSDKERTIRLLRRNGVAAIDFWSMAHPSLNHAEFGPAEERRRSTVALPTHQELAPRDLDRIVRAVTRANSSQQQPRVQRLDSLAALPGEWETLAEASANIFATREWMTSWWRHFGGGKQLLLFACRTQSGRLFAILPLYRYANRPLDIVRFLGHGPGDELGPICAPADRAQAASTLRRVIRALDPDVFLGEQLPGSEYLQDARATLLRRESSPVLRFQGGWEAFLSTRSANFRQQTRRRERRLVQEHAAVYRLSQDAGRLDDDLDTLFRLHSARWGTKSSTFRGRRRSFQRDFARTALARGWLRLWLMEVEGRAVAAWYGFRFSGVESYYQAGRDPRWDSPAVGTTLLAHSIRAALEDGIGEYRFLRGDEAFKYRFATHDVPIYSVGMASTLIGRAAVATAAAIPTQLATDALRLIGRQARR